MVSKQFIIDDYIDDSLFTDILRYLEFQLIGNKIAAKMMEKDTMFYNGVPLELWGLKIFPEKHVTILR